jgi:hypothetical protein
MERMAMMAVIDSVNDFKFLQRRICNCKSSLVIIIYDILSLVSELFVDVAPASTAAAEQLE